MRPSRPGSRPRSALRRAGRATIDSLRFAGMVLIGIVAVWALVLLFG